MTTSKIAIDDTSLVQVRLVEGRDTGHITVNDRHFAPKQGTKIDITPSLCEGTNIVNLLVNTNALKDDLSRLLSGKYEWLGNFEIYVNGRLAGSYAKQGNCIIGGKENVIALVEINVEKDMSKPMVMQLIKQLQSVPGMTDADKQDFLKAHPHILFKNGVALHTWKNYAGVDHVFIADRSKQCLYGGYVGWIHSKNLQDALQSLQDEFQDDVI